MAKLIGTALLAAATSSPHTSTGPPPSTNSLGAPEVRDASQDKYEVLGPAYADIGGELAQIVGGDPDRTFLYVEVGDRWLEGGVFKDEGDSVRYYDPSQELSDLIWKAWNTEEPNKRWSVMGYEITGTKFNARFKFPDEVDVEIYDADRRRTALKNHFGDKPVIYPPPPGQ